MADRPDVKFGSDGIRGIVGEWPLVSPGVMRIGQALGRYLAVRKDRSSVVIGCDTRPSGMGLVHALAAGLMDQGADVVDLGVMTTPGVAFITRWHKADLGIAISASHASYEYNGIKLVDRHGLRLQHEDELEIEALIRECMSQGVEPVAIEMLGQEASVPDLIELYIQDHVRRFPPNVLEDLCVVLDCAQGAASRVARPVFERLGARVIALNDGAEGVNINHRCGSEHVRDCPDEIVACMREHGAEYGFAFDGDGDRLVAVDIVEDADEEKVKVYDGFDLLFALGRYFYERGELRHNAVVTERRANRGLESSLRRLGIDTVYTENGDRNLEAEMWGAGYLLGSEAGGNIIINDGYHSAADAVYGALVLSRALVESRPQTLRMMVKDLRRHPQFRQTVDLRRTPLTRDQRAGLARLRRRKRKALRGGRIEIWGSTTEPGKVRVLVEGALTTPPRRVNKIGQEMIKWFEHRDLD